LMSACSGGCDRSTVKAVLGMGQPP
jgi:hypothetical protein